MQKEILLPLFLFLSSLVFPQDNKSLLDSANNAYSKNKFDAALAFYQKIQANGYESPELYYNIGNSYYKTKQLAMAILYYEKAKKISPADEDINYNLKLANGKLVDKIDVVPQLFLKDWWNGFLLLLTEKQWSLAGLVTVWLGFFFLLIYFMSNSRSSKQAGFAGAFLAFFLSFLFYFAAQRSFAANNSHTEGIITSLSVNIKGSPSEQGTDLFILHEGTKVSIEQNDGEWSEIKIPNGNRGWIKSSDLGVI